MESKGGNKMSTAEKIKSHREARGLSQKGLAKLIKSLNQSQICKIENKTRKITDTDLKAIAKALDVNVSQLIG
jgi:transcriptional regulator with XRE-family HTH domain